MAWGKWVYLGEGNGEFFRALEMFCILTGVWIIQVNMFAKTHHLRFVQDVVCKWYLGGTLCVCVCVCVCVLVAQSCPTLCDPMGCSPPSSSAHGILQARILEWVAISSSRGSSRPRDGTQVSCIAGEFFTTEPPGKLYM